MFVPRYLGLQLRNETSCYPHLVPARPQQVSGVSGVWGEGVAAEAWRGREGPAEVGSCGRAGRYVSVGGSGQPRRARQFCLSLVSILGLIRVVVTWLVHPPTQAFLFG